MTPEQIIKALKVCTNGQSCKKCPYEDGILCIESLMQEVLVLIKELQAHNENLKKENKYLRERLAEEAEIKEDMKAEGKWIGKTDYAGYGYYCSNCNAVFTGENAEWIAKEHKYCPKCGAKMKGE